MTYAQDKLKHVPRKEPFSVPTRGML
jgi:hypothetical protein